MDAFGKTAAVVLLTVVLTLTVGKQEKDLSVLLNMAVSCMCAMIALLYLEPVLDFVRDLESAGNLNHDMLNILLKAVGIGLVTELAGLICADAGCCSLGKSLQMLGSSAIIYISIPVFQNLLNLVRAILGEL